jgi:ornithine cyclodeaminase/alanine dehydrogenase-like protein (mu-crystallin family)
VPLYLSEGDVESLLSAADAVPLVEDAFRRMAAGDVELVPRRRLPLGEGGFLNVMPAVDRGLGVAGLKSYASTPGGVSFAVLLFSTADGSLEAVVEADALGRLRTGAASGVAARHLARAGAATLGVIGCGDQAVTQVAAIRAALPSVERVLAWCRTPERLTAFCERVGAEPADGAHDAAGADVVVTITTSRDPVLRGDWLSPGALVCAVGANRLPARELDNETLRRASFVCCDFREQARRESGDLVEPVEAGVLDWLEVHELHEVVAGELPGRQRDDDVVVFKSNGIAAWDLAVAVEAVRLARERGVGLEV